MKDPNVIVSISSFCLGCIRYKGAKIQLLDLPGIIEGAKDGKGRGRQVIAVARTASLIFIGMFLLKIHKPCRKNDPNAHCLKQVYLL